MTNMYSVIKRLRKIQEHAEGRSGRYSKQVIKNWYEPELEEVLSLYRALFFENEVSEQDKSTVNGLEQKIKRIYEV